MAHGGEGGGGGEFKCNLKEIIRVVPFGEQYWKPDFIEKSYSK